ncbi:hypothetical protein [Leptospira sp. GIMC2001]|uniref:hypothetical protein n=1 Tax=Leptospira sp. GIMC2001 TaxID=1513297 RepID=UPI00234947DC|nr:hypothetical protein [Leptospira sp. GIMC2001]WCL47648.1 hypothetical protein O4O04_01385 [Leptospira sp. GIMC2001]
MKLQIRIYQLISLMILLPIVIQCTTTATIRTEPINVDIYQDNELLGKSPLEHDFSNFLFNRNEIELRKEDRVIRKTELVREGKFWTTVGCYFLYVPCLWIAGPKKDQLFILENYEIERINQIAK